MQARSFCDKNISKSAFYAKKSVNHLQIQQDNKKTSSIANQKQFKRKNLLTSRSVSSITHNRQSQKQNKKCKNKREQLLQSVQIFHQTLTTFPLDRLILSQHPYQWIREQSLTLQKMRQKITRFKQIQSYQYYLAKLNSIDGIINNIKNNLMMLTKMSTLNSMPSQEVSSKGKSSFSSNQLQSSRPNQSSQKYSKNSYCRGQNKQNMMNIANRIDLNQNFNNLISQQQQMFLRSASFNTLNHKDQFLTIYSQQESQATNYRTDQSKNFYQQKSILNPNFQETKRIKENNTKRLYKAQTQLIQDGKKLKQASYQWIGSGLTNKISEAETKRIESQSQFQNRQIQIREEIKKKFAQHVKYANQQFKQKQMHYLEQIHQLKEKLSQQAQSIKQLLIQDQGYQQKIQALQQKQKSSVQQSLIYLNRIGTLQKNNLLLIDQIKLYKNRQCQLRETVLLERQRTKSFLQNNKSCEEQMEQKHKLTKQLQLQIQQLRQQSKNSQKKATKLIESNQILKQKQQIYRIKYFRTKSQYQSFKQKLMNQKSIWSKMCIKCKQQLQKSPNKADQAQQLKEIIQFHKKNLFK